VTRNMRAIDGTDNIGKVWVKFPGFQDSGGSGSLWTGESDISGLDWLGRECN